MNEPTQPTTELPAWANQPLGAGGKVGLVVRIILAVFFTPIFVSMAVGLRQFHVIVVLVVVLLVIAFLGSGTNLLQRYPLLDKVKLLGGTLRITGDLDAFYREHPPRSFLLYAVYPFYAVIGSIASKVVRREIWLHLRVMAVVAIVLVLEAATSYLNIYPPYLGPDVAAKLLLAQLIVVLLIATLYLMPMLSTTYALGLSGRRKTLRTVVVVSLILSALMGFGTYKNSSELLPWLEQQRLGARLRTADFRRDLDDLVEMFLDHAAQKEWLSPKAEPRVDAEGTKRFRHLVRGIVVGVEYRSFDIISFKREDGTWSGVRSFLGNRVYLLYLRDPSGKLYRKWSNVPKDIKKLFRLGVSYPERQKAETISGGLLHDTPSE